MLANVPRATSDEVSFSDEQIDMLVRNTQQMGAGLVMLGGPDSFGAGGWTGTELEKAMPVDFQIRNAEVGPRGGAGALDARQRDRPGQLPAKARRQGGDQGPQRSGLLRRDAMERQSSNGFTSRGRSIWASIAAASWGPSIE